MEGVGIPIKYKGVDYNMFDMKRKYYVYEWIRLDTNEPFYVGKGTNARWKTLNRRGNKGFMEIVNNIPVAVNILNDNLNEVEAFEIEAFYVNEYTNIGYELTNQDEGGCKYKDSKKHLEKVETFKKLTNQYKNGEIDEKTYDIMLGLTGTKYLNI